MLNFHKQTFTVKEERNEDACLSNDCSAVLSDGAGGCGIFCADWAQFLCTQFIGYIPPTASALNDRLGERYNLFTDQIEAGSFRSASMDKFYREGSYATWASVSFTPDARQFSVCTYGDSPVFHYSKERITLLSTCESLSSFVENPHLLNWIEEIKSEQGFFLRKDIPFASEDLVFLTSDALGQLLLTYSLVLRTMRGDEEAKAELSATLATPSKLSGAVNKVLSAYNQGINHALPLSEQETGLGTSGAEISRWYRVFRRNKTCRSKIKISRKEFYAPFVQKTVSEIPVLPKDERELMYILKTIAQNEKLFAAYMRLCYDQGYVVKDDYTLVLITAKTSR